MVKGKRKREKSLRPSFREKKRYMLLNVRKGVDEAILRYIGEIGYGKVSPQWVKGKDKVLAINKEKVHEVKAALELKNIEVEKVSGTLKSLEK